MCINCLLYLTSSTTFRPSPGKGQNEGGFSDEQIQMYKDCFKLMDINKDGQLDKNDLRGAFDNVGVLMTEGELDSLLGEVGVINIISSILMTLFPRSPAPAPATT